MFGKLYHPRRRIRALESLYCCFCNVAPKLSLIIKSLGTKRSEQWLARIEHSVKNLLFQCRMCGQCVLSSTGMVCPMNCAKELRNGPCGGVRENGHCEVISETMCVWLKAHEGAKHMRTPAAFHQIQTPLDHSRKGSATWLRIIQNNGDNGHKVSDVRHTIIPREPKSFELACLSGNFVVTAEISPPDSIDPQDLLSRAAVLRGMVDAINVTDNAGANSHMSSAAASALLAGDGHTPVFQVACRDRNRIAIQADIVGAAAQGVRNILCLTGDGVSAGDHPQAKPVFDLDAISLLGITKGMRDQGIYASGRKLMSRPDLFLGATINPFSPSLEARVLNLEKKLRAGAQFVQTQFCFDLVMIEKFMQEVRAKGLEKHCHILVGVGPLLSARTAKWLNNNVPGVHVPWEVIHRLEQAKDPKFEGVRICIETITALKEMPGIRGIHLMGHKNEAALAEIIIETGLANRTVPEKTPPMAVNDRRSKI